MPQLFLGKYVAVEKSAPAGFIINEVELPFEFTYGGQTVELVSTSLDIKNDFQEVELMIHKDEESIKGWKGNSPMLETVPSEEKIFGLYNVEAIHVNDCLTVVPNSLMAVIKTSDGIGHEQLNLQVGNYYVKELSAGSLHELDTRQFPFTFDGNNQDRVVKINVSDEEDQPILNKLHFISFLLSRKTRRQFFMRRKVIRTTFLEMLKVLSLH
ncbi:MSCRAMM family protein [Enterococcus plantarum]|uniref:MSCRAMM family protein n=1 Tax=Enterococcus plantarum TaxID=1077675 RepID=UPI001F5E42FE|nr:SpaA isopeptide-forming pilin-related protein [Enterococcus plantarum]